MQASESRFLINKPSGVSPEKSPLTPELEGFIKRTLVPLLVARYIEKLNRRAQELDGGKE